MSERKRRQGGPATGYSVQYVDGEFRRDTHAHHLQGCLSLLETQTAPTAPPQGGYPAFTKQFPGLCRQSSSTPSSHVQISVSASLPVSLTSSSQRKLKLQSAPADDSDRYGPPVQILPHLILGCAKDSSNLSVLRQLGVTAVLNVSHNCPSLFQSQLQYMEIRVPDTYQADLLARLDEAFLFIDGVKASGGRVLVHCHAGVSRSATVCMAYVMKTLNYDLRSAYDFVKSKRSCVSPNLHFMGPAARV
ncbi:Dual specificity protein phosphatase 1 [Geodia barretti]|uniref:protein-tyrosine-phosphatase n=1 Tax=Geodia barretti TaxID=519541 RepID=A0AA35R463_GEOBA|nr:Dual specificity protein phosphatase 1 [Geodia barretti]